MVTLSNVTQSVVLFVLLFTSSIESLGSSMSLLCIGYGIVLSQFSVYSVFYFENKIFKNGRSQLFKWLFD